MPRSVSYEKALPRDICANLAIVSTHDDYHIFSTNGRKRLEFYPALRTQPKLKDVWAVDGTFRGAISDNGDVYVMAEPVAVDPNEAKDSSAIQIQLVENKSLPRVLHLARTHDGGVCIVVVPPTSDSIPPETCIIHFSTAEAFEGYLHSHLPQDLKSHTIQDEIIQLVGGATSFAALTSSGSVYTWGSALQPQMLARDIQDSAPAAEPNTVDMLEGLFVSKVTMCEGWLGVALTKSGQMYTWGSTPGAPALKLGMNQSDDDDETSGPRLCGLENWDEVEDVAVGMEHIIVLADGKLSVAGRGQFGQLGLGSDTLQEEWKETEVGLENRGKVREVIATRWDTFIVVDEDGSKGT
jgi:hypothetical protein